MASGIRFAPSPTGAFHVGNFRTAWISFEWARALGQPWIVRFEDIDAPRVIPGAREGQLDEMARLGLAGGRVQIQSEHIARHREAFVAAVRAGKAYPCACSRKEVQEAVAGMASAPHAPVAVYSGRCRRGLPPGKHASLAWRFRADDPSGAGDFIAGRSAGELDARGLPDPAGFAPSYNWACAIDDWDGDFLLLVRCWDLASVAGHQRAIQEWLAAPQEPLRAPPAVFHTALVTSDDGHRLEKRTRGVTLPELLARGLSEADLVERFRESFREKPRPPRPGELFGESRRTITLSELGLGCSSADQSPC